MCIVYLHCGPGDHSGESTTTKFLESNSTAFNNATEVAECAAPSCCRPQPASDVVSETVDQIDCRFPHTIYREYPRATLAHENACYKSSVQEAVPLTFGSIGLRAGYAATQGED